MAAMAMWSRFREHLLSSVEGLMRVGNKSFYNHEVTALMRASIRCRHTLSARSVIHD